MISELPDPESSRKNSGRFWNVIIGMIALASSMHECSSSVFAQALP
jgi:hypothetical protein